MIEGLPASDALTPADRYLELFEHVQSSRIFADSKTFPDCAPKMDPLDILIRYRKIKRKPEFDLRQFVARHFWMPENYAKEYISDPSRSLKEHIDHLWPVLTREPRGSYPVVFLAGAAAGLYCAPAVDSAKPTTGTPISPCLGWRKAAVTICCAVWRITLRG